MKWARVSRGSALAMAVLALAIAVNLAQFPGHGDGRSERFKALHPVESTDVMKLAFDDDNFQARYAYSFALGQVAPGSSILYDPSEPPEWRTAQKFVAYGRADELRPVALDWARLPPDFDPRPNVVASGPGGRRGQPWIIAIDDSPSLTNRLQNPDEYLENTFEDADRSASTHPARDFVFLHWNTPRQGSNSTYQLLLIERSLLPTDVVEEPAQ